MDIRDIRLFPCKKIGISESGLVWRVDYEFLYIKNECMERGGLPLQYAFDEGWYIESFPKTISHLRLPDVVRILEINEKNHTMSREEVIADLVRASKWATDTLIDKDAMEFIAELKKELDR